MASNSKAEPGSESQRPRELIQRGVYSQNRAGILTFIGLRAADPILQHAILARGIGSSLLHKLGFSTLPAGPPNTGTFLDALGLSPYRLVLLGMAVGSSVKQIYWILRINREDFTPGMAVGIGAYNTLFNSINDLFFTTAQLSASLSSGGVFPQTPFLVGAAFYAAGLALETAAEIQRKRFKDDPKNAGRPYTEGLWAIARHINYTGYTLWRTGYAVAAGGWGWGVFALAYQGIWFYTNAIPALDGYCQERYGGQWSEYKEKVSYKFVPYIY